MTIIIRLLGSPEIYRDELSISLPGYKPLALLAYLLHHPQPQQRQHLVDLLFDSAKNPRASLRWALSQLKKAIGEECLLATRQTIGFNYAADFELDVTAFLQGDTAVYRGDFLQGLEVRDGRRFMEWVYIQRQRYRHHLQEALAEQLGAFQNANNHHAVIETGHRLLQLDTLREEWYRALMQAYVQLGRKDEAVQLYQTCQTVLANELSIQPAAETTMLYEEIIIHTAPAKPAAAPPIHEPSSPSHEFPIPFQPTSAQSAPFYARKDQLSQLERHFQTAVSQQGRVVFISGSVGRGKTALATRFVTPLMQQSEAVVGFGTCNAYDGLGDAFLPFRDIFDALTGNVAWAFAQGILTVNQAKEQWHSLVPTIRLILQNGPLLLNTLISIDVLVNRLQWIGTAEAEALVAQLQHLQHQTVTPDSSNQSQLFQQTADVLHQLSEQTPLILILDDLHWSDRSSLALLFHLARRIQHSRLLIICTYRPEDIMVRPDGAGLTLTQLIAEIRRLFGESHVDLEILDAQENREFVNLLLQSRFSQVSSSFAQRFYDYTRGHPLFTVELLRSMPSTESADDATAVSPNAASVAWSQLPERVEAVIEMRLRRLPEDVQQVLQVAAVEGNSFTAQVVARVAGLSERRTVSLLGRLMGKQHHILTYVARQQTGDQTLDRYQFQHRLFQQYLFEQQTAVERRLLHGEIADVLASIYGDRIDSAALTVAGQYERAGLLRKATHYYGRAADLASRRFAHEEVIHLVSKALALTSQLVPQAQYDIVSIREQSYGIMGLHGAQQADLQIMQQLADTLSDDHTRAEVGLRHAGYYLSIGQPEQAYASAAAAVTYAQSCRDVYLEAMGYLYQGRALMRQQKQDATLPYFQKALHLARQAQMQQVEATSLRSFGEFSRQKGEFTSAQSFYRRALMLYPDAEYSPGRALALQNMGELAQIKGDFYRAQTHFLEALQAFQEIGHRQGEGRCLVHLGVNAAYLGDYYRARQYLVRGLTAVRKIGNRDDESKALSFLGLVATRIRDGETAVFHCRQAVEIAQASSNLRLRALSYFLLGRACLHQQQYGEAEAAFAHALQSASKQTQGNLFWLNQAGLAQAALDGGDVVAAEEIAASIWDNWHRVTINGRDFPLWILVGCHSVFTQAKDARAEPVLITANQQLQEWVAQIADPTLQQRFLKDVPEHAQIMAAFAARGGDVS